ncbi:MAG TPA: PQQ-binding-like beta-propeller repeat protein [Bryobacteraceae bacterium]|nr:PQQ-binding-like beta-propeller repeat protein [Bryobacteraceae bacterium]
MKALALTLLTSMAALAQPTVTVSPAAGPPTSQAAVGGRGFAAEEAVDIYFDTTDLALATTSATGRFAGIGLVIPAAAVPGTHWISAVGRRSGLAAQTPFLVRTDWAEFRRGRQRLGYDPTENILGAANVAGMQLRWLGANGGGGGGAYSNSAVIAGGMVYASAFDGELRAFDADTGRPVWSTEPGLKTSTTPTVADGVIYVGVAASDAMLYAFNAATGKQLWTADLGVDQFAGMLSSPVVADGVVYVGSPADSIYALRASTGGVIWQAPIFGEVYAAPALANGVVYVCAGGIGSQVYAFNAATGEQLWIADTGYEIYAAPAVANGVVYVASTDYNLYAFNAETGQPIWKQNLGDVIYASPAVANGVVYVNSNKLYAFDAITGQAVWTQAAVDGDSSPAVANGVVYVKSADDNIYALDAATGLQLWSAAIDSASEADSSPAVANGIVYIPAADSYLYAFSLPVEKTAQPPARPNPATLMPDVTLVAFP